MGHHHIAALADDVVREVTHVLESSLGKQYRLNVDTDQLFTHKLIEYVLSDIHWRGTKGRGTTHENGISAVRILLILKYPSIIMHLWVGWEK